jgi:hypothetical protein
MVQVELAGPEGQSDFAEVEATVGEVAAVTLTLAAPEPEPVVEPEPPPPPPVVAVDTKDPDLRMIGMVAGGVGIAGLVVFGACGAVSSGKYRDLERACPTRTGCDPALEDEADAGETLQTVANVGLVVGAIGVVAGVTLYVLGSLDEETEVALGPGSISIRGSL